jgi:hypothetical protein
MERADRERQLLGQSGNPFCYGLPLVGAAMLVFLLPLVLGIVAGRLAEAWLGPVLGLGAWWQVPGLGVGFLAGVGIGRLVIWAVMLRRRRVSGDDPAETAPTNS